MTFVKIRTCRQPSVRTRSRQKLVRELASPSKPSCRMSKAWKRQMSGRQHKTVKQRSCKKRSRIRTGQPQTLACGQDVHQQQLLACEALLRACEMDWSDDEGIAAPEIHGRIGAALAMKKRGAEHADVPIVEKATQDPYSFAVEEYEQLLIVRDLLRLVAEASWSDDEPSGADAPDFAKANGGAPLAARLGFAEKAVSPPVKEAVEDPYSLAAVDVMGIASGISSCGTEKHQELLTSGETLRLAMDMELSSDEEDGSGVPGLSKAPPSQAAVEDPYLVAAIDVCGKLGDV